MNAESERVLATIAAIPEWAVKGIPAFREVLRVISLSESFTLVPVEISGPDVARVLADWLTAVGHPAHVFAPLDDDEWRELVTSIFALSPRPRDIVVIIGTRDLTPAVAAAIRSINQRRDTIARQIGRPLLWCGPHDFLDATWEIAPDFWSIRALTQTVEGVMSLPPEPSVGPSYRVSDGVERVREIWNAARQRGDARSMERVALSLATALMEALDYEEAEAVLEETQRLEQGEPDSPARRSIALLGAQAHLSRGALDEARRALDAVPLEPLDDTGEGERALVLGNLRLAAAEEGAIEAYRAAEEAFSRIGDRRNVGVAKWSCANAEVGMELPEEAVATFEGALNLFREIADARNEARALSSLGRVHAALHDMRKANAYFDDALAITRELGDLHGEATVLRRLARIYVTIGDPEKALEDCDRALVIARTLGDRRGEGKSLIVLGAARSALGDRMRAEELLGEARVIADELGDARMQTAIERAVRSLPPPPSR